MWFLMSKTLSVRVRKYCEMAVTPSLCSMEKRVIGRYERSSPTRVMSVPCRVVTNGNCFRGGVAASICLASIALTECGIA